MKVLFAVAECAPFVKTGGLGDVAQALPKALAALGVEVWVLLPAYRDAVRDLPAGDPIARFDDPLAGSVQIRSLRAEGLNLLLLDAPDLYDRPGNPYVQPDGTDWPDNLQRFGFLSRIAAEISAGQIINMPFDVLHAHDWHTGLAPLYARLQENAPASMMTIHNIMYQGLFPGETRRILGLPEQGFAPDGYEFHGKVGFLKAGLIYADKIGTVSPTYARELREPSFGLGLDGLIRHRADDMVGILNGVDTDIWNPATDPLIAANYKAPNMKARARNRRAVAARFELEKSDGPLLTVVSRLTRQKGLDLLVDALPDFIEAGGQLALLGSGDRDMERAFEAARQAYPGKVGVVIGYDEALSHQVQAGADAICVPSRFEPCGLTQMYGLRYGCLPLVARTGGLADTVIDIDADPDTGTGFVCEPDDGTALADALDRLVCCFGDKDRWRAAQRRAMKQALGWDASASAYLTLYRQMADGTGAAA